MPAYEQMRKQRLGLMTPTPAYKQMKKERLVLCGTVTTPTPAYEQSTEWLSQRLGFTTPMPAYYCDEQVCEQG